MFLTLIHDGSGSMVEAADPWFVFGPYATAQEADDAGEQFYHGIEHTSDLGRIVWFTVIEIPDPASVDVQKEIDQIVADYGDEEPEGDPTAVMLSSIGDLFPSPNNPFGF